MEKKYLIITIIGIILIIAIGAFLLTNSSEDEQKALDVYNNEMASMLPIWSYNEATSAELVDYNGEKVYKINHDDGFIGDAYVYKNGTLVLNGTIS